MTWRWRLAALLLGGVCVAFGQGRWPVPLAAWLAPVLLIAYVRAVPISIGIVGFTIVHGAAWEIAYLGMIKMPMFARWGLLVGLSLLVGLVYLADRWVAQRRAGFWTTLVFPCGWVLFDYLNGRFSPSGSWASIAYTFPASSSLAQVASLVGWTGVTFLVGWVASVVHWVIVHWVIVHWVSGRGPCQRRALVGPGVCASVVVAVLVFGSVRLWTFPQGETIRVANLVGPSTFLDGGEFRRDVWAYTRGIEIPADRIEAAQLHIEQTIERHLELAERELVAGAAIVLFPEANPSITKREEAAFVASASRLASRYEAYVGLGLFVFRPEAGLPAENKFVLVGPDGSIVWDYLKATRVPGSRHVVGDGVLPDVATSLGRLGCAICFDMDFPILLAQAGRNQADIVLAPSNDWTEVRAIHASMATMRAVEQGFTLVRPTKDGFSLVADPMGRVLASQDTDRPGDHVLVADVPTVGIRTVYSVIGDAFSLACALAFVALLACAAMARPQSNGGP